MFLNPPLPLVLPGVSRPQLREEFDRGIDVQLDEDYSVHDVAALLKEFLRDMPDPLLTRELYTAFINTTCELHPPPPPPNTPFFHMTSVLLLLFFPLFFKP